MPNLLNLALAAALASALAWSSPGRAQEPSPPKDEALDRLLQKLDDKSSGAKNEAAPVEKKETETVPPPAPPKDNGPAAEKGKGKGEVDSRDQALDSLLEKLGETKDAPTPEERPKNGGGKPDEPMPPKSGAEKPKPKPEELSGKEKDLDEHLEEAQTGRPKKKKGRDDEAEGSGPLGEVMKKMREVEERLGKPDTGEQTRQKQAEIVKKLEQVIEEVRKQSSGGQGKKRMQLGMRQGKQQGAPSGSGNKNPNGQGVGASKPLTPNAKRALVNGKDEWGHLPPELRLELENVSKEAPLTAKEDLIRRYYLSVNKKSLNREE